jgi:DNA-binding IclR family transcriptional regulator
MPETLPPIVLAFMSDHVRTLEELQLLIALIQSPDRWWDAGTVARELGLSRSTARQTLDHLASRNLLDIRITGDVRYQFRPGTEELRTAALALEDAYRVRPLALVQLVAGQTKRGIRDFADAFRIRRDDDR